MALPAVAERASVCPRTHIGTHIRLSEGGVHKLGRASEGGRCDEAVDVRGGRDAGVPEHPRDGVLASIALPSGVVNTSRASVHRRPPRDVPQAGDDAAPGVNEGDVPYRWAGGEIRIASNGHVIGPYSRHRSGVLYEPLNGSKVAELPAALLRALRPFVPRAAGGNIPEDYRSWITTSSTWTS
jgi:hypothetical protein